MSTERSYGRILWRNNILGFQMVNHLGDQYFIYAEPLLNVWNNPDSFVRIKRKDRKQNRNTTHHPGEIFGSIKELVIGNKPFTKLTLHFSEVEKLIDINQSGDGLLNVVDTQNFTFPKAEFAAFIKSIHAMHSQHTHFNLLMNNIEVLAP